MKILFFIATLILTAQVSASDLASGICGPEATSAKLKDDWEKNKKGRYCATANCVFPKEPLEREKCFWAGGGNKIGISTTDLTSSARRGKADFIVLNAEEPCIQYCGPVQKGSKTISSFDRKECIECFKKRALFPVVEELNYPELGRSIRKGQKCYFRCEDKGGDIKLKRVLSPECKACLDEKFSYLQTNNGLCWEVDSEDKTYKVDNDFCTRKSAAPKLRTTYVASVTFTERMMGKDKTCYEVDEETLGRVYKMYARKELCELEHVDNSGRAVVEKPSGGTTVKKPKTGSSKQ
jgi:hypothetical protein